MTTQHKPSVAHEAAGALERATLPRFSIILCTYNRRNLVLSTLASLRRQTLPYSEFEIIVIDNGSTDGTLAAVRTYVNAGNQDGKKPEDVWRVQCISEPQNGVAHARNTGLLVASGEIAVFIDDDTIADVHLLERLLKTYEETGADAIGGRVDVRFDAARPHWLTDDLCELLGYFAPFPERTQLKEGMSFSSSCFSVRIEALRGIGYFSPFLSKRLHLPASMEVNDLCRRLFKAGCALWYEPEAAVAHRAAQARLKRAFFVGRAYWQGRSEVLAHYAGGGTHRPTFQMLSAVFQEVGEIALLSFLHRPLLRLAGRSTSERLVAAMAQARSWGHLQQLLQFLEHAPMEVTAPAILFVYPPGKDASAELLAQAIVQQDVSCTLVTQEIPFAWLWRHRAIQKQAIGIVHLYRPGAFQLTPQKRQRFMSRLWLARRWGIRIVTTDPGGWWQSTRHLYFASQRSFERTLMQQSHMILAYTRQPEQLYPDKKLRRRVRCLPHPGFRGYYPQPEKREIAYQQLGLPAQAEFVYLCLASAHTERELLYLLESFLVMEKKTHRQSEAPATRPQLLLAGDPRDRKRSLRIFKLAALSPAIHFSLRAPERDEMPLYLGAADALVIPHFPVSAAGTLETALLALSFDRIVVAPGLPRFRGMLPPQASAFYDAGSREDLADALLKAQTLDHHLSEYEAESLDAESGWGQYAHRLLKLYKQLLQRR